MHNTYMAYKCNSASLKTYLSTNISVHLVNLQLCEGFHVLNTSELVIQTSSIRNHPITFTFLANIIIIIKLTLLTNSKAT